MKYKYQFSVSDGGVDFSTVIEISPVDFNLDGVIQQLNAAALAAGVPDSNWLWRMCRKFVENIYETDPRFAIARSYWTWEETPCISLMKKYKVWEGDYNSERESRFPTMYGNGSFGKGYVIEHINCYATDSVAAVCRHLGETMTLYSAPLSKEQFASLTDAQKNALNICTLETLPLYDSRSVVKYGHELISDNPEFKELGLDEAKTYLVLITRNSRNAS